MLRIIGLLFFFLLFTRDAFAADCINGTPYTTPGSYSCTVPTGITSLTGLEWGGGSSANGWLGSTGAGAGGGFCQKTLTVTPGATVFFMVAASTSGTTGSLTAGNNSWFNISSNAQPTSGSQGCYAQGGTATPGGSPVGGSGNFGDTNFTGGTGGTGSGAGGAGGGGGAGSGGNGGSGGNAPGGSAGSGGSPDGGIGGAGVTSGNGPNGTAPGGGGGYSNAIFVSGGNGAAGQNEFMFSSGPSFNAAQFFPFLK